jgi:hypothetical protein
MHVVLKIPYPQNCIIKLCRKQAEVIQNHLNQKYMQLDKKESMHRKHKRLELLGG